MYVMYVLAWIAAANSMVVLVWLWSNYFVVETES